MTLATSTASFIRRARSWCDNTGPSAASVCARCTGAISGVGENSLDISGNHIDFEVDAGSGSQVAKSRRRARMRDHVDLEPGSFPSVDRQAPAVHSDRALAREEAGELGGRFDDQTRAAAQILDGLHLPDPVDVAAHGLPAEAIGGSQRLLEGHFAPGLQP